MGVRCGGDVGLARDLTKVKKHCDTSETVHKPSETIRSTLYYCHEAKGSSCRFSQNLKKSKNQIIEIFNIFILLRILIFKYFEFFRFFQS